MLLLMLMENDEWDNGNIKFIAKVNQLIIVIQYQSFISPLIQQ